MKKRILSMILAMLLAVTMLAACNNGVEDPVDPDVDQNQEDVQGGDAEDPTTEDPTPEDPEDPAPEDPVEEVEAAEVIVLDREIDSAEVIEAAAPEKVLKATVQSLGDVDRRQLYIKLSEGIEVPAGSTFEYDVYLETDVAGMGILDIKVGKQNLSLVAVDRAQVGNFKDSDLRGCAYGRWYHRVFDLPNTETESMKTYWFSLGGLTYGCTNVCYYDNICIKDPDGNVIYTIENEFVANYEFKDSAVAPCKFELVDDPAYTGKRLAAEEILYRETVGTFENCESIELTFSLDDVYSGPAIFIGEEDESCTYGVNGYILALQKELLVLYRSGSSLTEVASKRIVDLVVGKEYGLKLDIEDDELRGYFVDDMEGVEPWPEFIVPYEAVGMNYGVMDLYSLGSTLENVTVTEIEPAEAENYYVNSVQKGVADPDVLYHDGVYYLYGTYGPGYQVWSSTDLVNWEHRGQCLDHPGACWAPDVEYYNGKFYMACTIDRTLVIAVADSPLGPFVVDPEPLLGFITFDGHFFIDDDGQAYIYYTTDYEGRPYGIYGAKFDFETRKMDYSTEVCCIVPEIEWETYGHSGEPGGNRVVEGAYILKKDGTYYLTYSGGHFEYKKYAVGYATSQSPLGPFVKYEANPVHIGTSAIHGTAHHSFTTTPDGELIIVYHCHSNLEWDGGRDTCIDRARFVPTESGVYRLETYGPTVTPQPLPLG